MTNEGNDNRNTDSFVPAPVRVCKVCSIEGSDITPGEIFRSVDGNGNLGCGLPELIEGGQASGGTLTHTKSSGLTKSPSSACATRSWQRVLDEVGLLRWCIS